MQSLTQKAKNSRNFRRIFQSNVLSGDDTLQTAHCAYSCTPNPNIPGDAGTEGPLLSQKRLHLPTPKGCATSGLTPPGTDASNGAEQTRARSKEGGGAGWASGRWQARGHGTRLGCTKIVWSGYVFSSRLSEIERNEVAVEEIRSPQRKTISTANSARDAGEQ